MMRQIVLFVLEKEEREGIVHCRVKGSYRKYYMHVLKKFLRQLEKNQMISIQPLQQGGSYYGNGLKLKKVAFSTDEKELDKIYTSSLMKFYCYTGDGIQERKDLIEYINSFIQR